MTAIPAFGKLNSRPATYTVSGKAKKKTFKFQWRGQKTDRDRRGLAHSLHCPG